MKVKIIWKEKELGFIGKEKEHEVRGELISISSVEGYLTKLAHYINILDKNGKIISIKKRDNMEVKRL